MSRDFDAMLQRRVLDPIAPFWPPQNQLIVDGYRDLPFPFGRVDFPPMAIEVRWTLEQYLAYIATWTATRRMREKSPAFLDGSVPELEAAWGAEAVRAVTMPLVILCGRHG